MNRLKWQAKVIPVLIALLLFIPLGITAISSLAVAADEAAQYTAAQIEDWLISKVKSATITYTSPTVVLDTDNTVKIEGFSLSAGGTDVGLETLMFRVNGSTNTTVSIVADLLVFDIHPLPRLSCNADIECSDGVPQITNLQNIEIKYGEFKPSFSSTDLNNIEDAINKALDASGLTLDSPGGDLTGIEVVGGKLKLSWSGGGPLECDAADIEAKLDGALSTLKTEAEDYLSTGNPSKWSCNVTIDADTRLTFNAQATIFDLTAKIEDMDITFPVGTAANATGAVSLESKRATFNATGDISCANYTPSLMVNTLGIGDEYPGLRDYIADPSVNSALRDAMGDLVDNAVNATGLRCRLATFTNIGIVGDNLKIWLEGIPISGVTCEVTCDILGDVTVNLYRDSTVIDSDVSDAATGEYELIAPEAVTYTVVASKTGFREETQQVVVGTNPVPLDFCGNTGLIPNVPRTPYLVTCIHYWLHHELGCGLDTPKLVSVIHYWLHPVYE